MSRRLRAVADHILPGSAATSADFVVRSATVVDGTGAAPFKGDVAVRDSRIVYVGPEFGGAAAREYDGRGRVLAPGLIDTHTHYDPQLCWDGAAKPCLEHGVTTIVTGNCSLSVAPVRDEDAALRMVGMFNTIEDIKKATFAEGVPFHRWRSFGEWLDFLRPRLSINVAALVGHSAIRLFVMGSAAQEREATPEEVAQMAKIAEEAVAAGAVGVSTSYVDIDEEKRPVPSRFASLEEKMALAAAMRAGGRRGRFNRSGVWACVHSFNNAGGRDGKVTEAESLRELGGISAGAGVPVSWQPVNLSKARMARVVPVLDEVAAAGGRMYGQVSPGDVHLHLRLGETNLSMMGVRHWGRMMKIQPREARIAAFSDPKQQDMLIQSLKRDAMRGLIGTWVVTRAQHPESQRYLGKALAQIAEEEGVELGRAIIDISLRDGLEAEFTYTLRRDLDNRRMIADLFRNSPHFHMGAADSGAHVTQKCGTGETTDVLANFVKDGILPLEEAVYQMTGRAAAEWALADRGTLKEGNWADLVLFNLDKVETLQNQYVCDLPGNQSRYVRSANGFELVFVNGRLCYKDGRYCDGIEGCGQVV